jgi:FKBP-type peptidyl-prolyl cis-trans isomerase 2
MAITKGDIIKLSFTGRLENGSVFDTTDEKTAKESNIFDEDKRYEPMIIVVGSNTLVHGLEEDLVGKKTGQKGKVTVTPEEAYGFRSLELIETVSTKKFTEKIEPGQWVESGDKVGVVESVSGGRARIDYNEPLAGKTLIYEYEIDGIIQDKDEKVDAIIKGYVGPDTKYEHVGDTVSIEVPKGYYLENEWILGKVLVARFLVSFVGVKEVNYKETFTEADLVEKSE